MKKLILFAAILFAGVSVVKAQETGDGNSKLVVNLHPVQSIEVSGSATIEYKKPIDYTDGEFVNETTGGTTLVKVTSAGKFSIAVHAADLKSSTGTDNVIAANTIDVTATAKETTRSTEGVEKLTLGNEKGTALISSDNGGINIEYDVKFRASGGSAYMNLYNNNSTLNNTVQEYETTVYYTLLAN